MVGLKLARLLTVQQRLRLRRKYQGQFLSNSKPRVKHSSQQAIFMVVESTLALRGKKKIPIPLMPRLKRSRRALQKKRRRSFKRNNANPVLHRLNFHLPSVSVGSGMKIPVTYKNFSINPRNKERSASRRLQRSHQQPVISRGRSPRSSPRGKSPDAVGNQPLTAFRQLQVAQDFSSKLNFGKKRQVLRSALLQKFCHQSAPPRLVAGAKPGAVVAMKIFVEENHVPPVRIAVDKFLPAGKWPLPVFAPDKDPRQALRNLLGHLP